MKRTLWAPQLCEYITCQVIGEMNDGTKIWERDNETEYQFSCQKGLATFIFYIMTKK